MGKRETPRDVGVVCGSMGDLIMARTFSHHTLEELAEGSKIPVINGLSDLEHPCQILADFQTIYECCGRMKGLKIAYLGDGNNNVTHSLALMATMLGNRFYCAAPKGYWMRKSIAREARAWAEKSGGQLVETTDPRKAAEKADVVVTDTWVSMGTEKERKKRLKVFPPFQVSARLMALAKQKAIFMHCLPAYRGKEVAGEVIDGKQSVVFQEAENRLHAQKALLVKLAGVRQGGKR
jgi:ornithine carbamoyltransferase